MPREDLMPKMDSDFLEQEGATASLAQPHPSSSSHPSTATPDMYLSRPGPSGSAPSAATATPPRFRIKLTQNHSNEDAHSNSTPNWPYSSTDLESRSASGPVAISQLESTRPSLLPPDREKADGVAQGSSSRERHSESLSPVPGSPSSPQGNRSFGENNVRDGNTDGTPSPTKIARRRRQAPVFICSRDYAPLPPESQQDSQRDGLASTISSGSMKRADPSRSKTKNDGQPGTGSSGGQGDGVSESNGSAHLAPNPSLHPLRKMQSASETGMPPLPLNTSPFDNERVPMIPTHMNTPRRSPARLRPRLFDLEEAPTFYPTKEEFADPLRYIEYVGDPQGGNGKAYGIVKIVPPEGWNPDFVLNQDQFRFRTRMQRLNSLSADARASLNYQEQLQKFHAQQGHARVSIPVVDRRPVDLYQLKLTVSKLGGHEAVAKSRRWAEVTRRIGYDEKDAAHLAAQIKAAYTRIILPFEKFLVANREALRKEAASMEVKQRTTSPEQQSFSASPSSSRAPSHVHTAPASQTNYDSAALNGTEGEKLLFEDNDSASSKRRSTRRRADTAKASSLASQARLGSTSDDALAGSSRRNEYMVQPGAEEQMCEICLRGDNGLSMLLCDDCNRGYHMYCLDPPLASVPKSQWYCPPCLVGTGNDYGFDDGETHSLSSFWKRAESFRAAWWSEREDKIWTPPDGGHSNGLSRAVAGTGLRVAEDDVEREFWRLVHSPDENVEVEYGADVHSTTHGSAMPTLETHPLSRYSRDGWNLNNLPILPGSLLRYIKSDISGMTVPWIYIGMIFSTFCWHNEDHYTYSINYQHFGDTKTWYGVPGSDAHLLEEALRAAAPDLFEQSPDLLFQLVTMMSPDKLKRHGVKVYACDQRANEFVITYPKAYHSGFNHGFNVNEAVNFALPDWIDFGLEGVRRYQQYHKFPVFSHDELVVTVYQHNQSVDTAMWLQTSMEEMVKREIERRNELRRLIPNITEQVESLEEDYKAEKDYQCAHCKVFCYLSQVASEKSDGVACLVHANEVCGSDSPSRWTLRLRYTDNALTTMLAKTVERAAVPTTWKARFRKVIVASARPNLRNLRGLLHEGEKIPFEMPEVEGLRIFVDKANRWVDEATSFISRRHQKRSGGAGGARDAVSTVAGGTALPRRTKSRRGSKAVEEEEESDMAEELGDQERVYTLLAEAEMLPFDAPELAALRGVVDAIEEFKRRSRLILRHAKLGENEAKLVECEEVLSLGTSLNVKLDELSDLQAYVGRRHWFKEVGDIQENFTQVDEVDSLISEGMALGVQASNPLMVMLQERHDNGLRWKAKAETMLGLSKQEPGAAGKFKAQDAEDLLRASYKVSVDPDLHVKIETMLKHVKDWTRQCEALLKGENRESKDEAESLKKYSDACKLVKHLQDSAIAIKDEEKVAQMKRTQDAIERRILYRLYGERNDGEPSQVPVVAARIEKDYLVKAEESCAPRDDDASQVRALPCICRSEKSDKGPAAKCAECSTAYHVSCIGISKKEARDKAWLCMFCRPSELLPALVRRHADKKTLEEIYQILSSGSILAQEEGATAPLHPWGPLATYNLLRQTKQLASRLCSTVQGAETNTVAQQVLLIKKLLHCPLRLAVRGEGPAPLQDPLLGLVEKIYALHGLDANGAPQRLPSSSSNPPSDYVAMHNMTASEQQPPSGGDHPDNSLSFNVSHAADYSDNEESRGGDATGKMSRSGDERKRKRGKRAKFVFEEEVGIFVPIHGDRIFCLCHRPKMGTMISCERCSLWFHNTCVHVSSEKDLADERWICPMCCVKTERKYPQAEVKVKAPGEKDPSLWLDVRATLRSIKGPVSKPQNWTVLPAKRIALHLESFYPATLPGIQDEVPQGKRQKTADGSPLPRHTRADSNSSSVGGSAVQAAAGGSAGEVLPPHPYALGSVALNPSWNDTKARITPAHRTPLAEERALVQAQQAQARHNAGMANLYSRGVTDAMIKKWYVGWNGRDLVYPRKDRFGRFHELTLGPRISLAPDDEDGTQLITSLLQKQADEKRLSEGPREGSAPSHRPSPPRSAVDTETARREKGTSVAKVPSMATLPSSHYPPISDSPSRSSPALPSLVPGRIPSFGNSARSPALPSHRPSALPPGKDANGPLSQRSQEAAPPRPLASRPSPVTYAPPSIPPYRGGSINLPPPTLPFTSRSPIGTDMRTGSMSSAPARPSNAPSQLVLVPPRRDVVSTSPRLPLVKPSMNGTSSPHSNPTQLQSHRAEHSTPRQHQQHSLPSSPQSNRSALQFSPHLSSRSLLGSPHMHPAASSRLPSNASKVQTIAASTSSPTSQAHSLPQHHGPPRSEQAKSATPEKSLEEYRTLARKMRPNATDEEIESMVRHAMS